MTLFPLWNPFHVLIVAIVLQYHLILIHTLLLAWMIVFIMTKAGTLHAKIILKRKRYSLSVLHVWPPIILDLLMVQQMVCKKIMKTATKHAKSQQHMNSMKYWKTLLLIQDEQQQSSIRDSSCDNDEMIKPSFSEPSDNNSIPETKVPGRNLTSLTELIYHDFDPDSNAPEFYWSEHKLSRSGVRNLTAKAFSLHTEQVLNAEAWFSLTISNLLIQLTESQRELFAQCMLHAANSKHAIYNGIIYLKNSKIYFVLLYQTKVSIKLYFIFFF